MHLSIKQKILIILSFVGVIPLLGVIVWQYNHAIDRLTERSFDQLNTVKQIKKQELEWYFSKIRTETGLFAQSSFIVKAMTDFEKAFFEIDTNSLVPGYKEILEEYYAKKVKGIPFFSDVSVKPQDLVPQENRSIFLQNQFLKGSKLPFQDLSYKDIHDRYHKSFSNFVSRYDVYDLFLIEDKTGNIVYSVTKESDYATSLLNGPYADSNIGRLYREIRNTGLHTSTIVCDFERYLPSDMAPAAFIAAPIFDSNTKVGTLIIQVPLQRINTITTGTKAWEDEGLGKTGETYIVGSDFSMRTDSRFILETPNQYLNTIAETTSIDDQNIKLMDHYQTTVLFQPVETPSVKKALTGISGSIITKDYRNVEVLSSFVKLDIEGLSWILLAEIDTAEVFHSVRKEARESLLVLGIVFVCVLFVSGFLGRLLYRPLRSLANAASELGKGNFDVQVDIKNSGEIGVFAKNFNDMVYKLKKGREEIVLKNEKLNKQKGKLAEQSQNLKKMNDDIVEFNKSLDIMVKERTIKLKKQNESLLKYAYFNSHKLRAPVSNILGIFEVLKNSKSEEDIRECLELLEKATHDLDIMIHYAQDLLKEVEI